MDALVSVIPLNANENEDDNTVAKSPYTDGTLTPTEQGDLSVVVHFLLLFRHQLGLSAYDLLDSNPEHSLLSCQGIVYGSLLAFFGTHYRCSSNALEAKLESLETIGERLEHLREMADEVVCVSELRAATMSEDGRVLGAARLRTSIRDGNGNRYVWLRGQDGCCSERILRREDRSRRETVMRRRESLKLVKKLEKGGKRDFVAAGWLRERVERARVRGNRVKEAEEERVREQKRREERIVRETERRRKLERMKKIVGEQEEYFGRGKRERRIVSYEEESAEEEEEEEEGGEEEEEFLLENQIKGESEDESEDGSEEDWEAEKNEEEEGRRPGGKVVAVGRVRVITSGRTTKNSRKAAMDMYGEGRPVRKCRRFARGGNREEAGQV